MDIISTTSENGVIYSLTGKNGQKYQVKIGNKRNSLIKIFSYSVDRSSPLGNPYILKDTNNDSERNLVCDKYHTEFQAARLNSEAYKYLDFLEERLIKEKEITLWCWCSPKRCHAETIAKELLERIYFYGK